MVNLSKISKSVIDGDEIAALDLIKEALATNMPAKEILDKGLIPGVEKVGDWFERGKIYLPELVVSGEVIAKALQILQPILGQGVGSYKGRFAIGTVQGDVHDLGKNIVIMMLKGNGWDVTDLGVDVSPEEFCSVVEKGSYDILGMSCLLTMTMPNAALVIETLKASRLRGKIKIMVGGAPTTLEWAKTIGADGFAKDGPAAAREAAALVNRL